MPVENPKVESEPSVLDLSNHGTGETGCFDLAKQISSILNNPKTPELFKDKFKDAITEIFNDGDFKQQNFIEHEKSPEYIEMILKGAGCSDE